MEGRCPVNFTSVLALSPEEYVENLSIHVWLKAEGAQSSRNVRKTAFRKISAEVFFPLPDLKKNPKIEVAEDHSKVLIYPFTEDVQRQKKVRLCTCCRTSTCIEEMVQRWRRDAVILCSSLIRVIIGSTRKSFTSTVPQMQQPG